ncbi:ladderlectin-like [Amphibalanus amphitrite]|uniref:ladderlectin-like n=1 Tax=Amphibalanus amphitrite TaxID=1232801 RepID=UPI001C92469C|nr:ladderlectin-like [Amphibalanus amphitrite]
MSPVRLCLSLLLMVPQLMTSSEARLVPVLPRGDHGRGTLATPATGSCAQCGVLCLLQPGCRAVACSENTETGTCQLLGDKIRICDPGWTEFESGRTCFIFQADKLDWNATRAACRNLRSGAELASIHSEEENNLVKSLIPKAGAFIGLEHTGPSATRDFRWLDGTPFDFTHWRDGQPNDNAENDLCVVAERETALWLDYTVQVGMLNYGGLCKYTP